MTRLFAGAGLALKNPVKNDAMGFHSVVQVISRVGRLSRL